MNVNSNSNGRELRIGEVAKRAETTPRTIRYYEELGLLPAGRDRQPGTHRAYAAEDVERLTDLLQLKELLGLSLDELREVVEVENSRAALRREWGEGVEDPARRRQILEQSNRHMSRQLKLVRRRRDEVARLEVELIAKRKRVRAMLQELEVG